MKSCWRAGSEKPRGPEEVGVTAVPDDEQSKASCLCGSCPSKPGDHLVFYCVEGKSPEPVSRGFCACSWCPVWSCYGLSGSLYCDEGAAGKGDLASDND